MSWKQAMCNRHFSKLKTQLLNNNAWFNNSKWLLNWIMSRQILVSLQLISQIVACPERKSIQQARQRLYQLNNYFPLFIFIVMSWEKKSNRLKFLAGCLKKSNPSEFSRISNHVHPNASGKNQKKFINLMQ